MIDVPNPAIIARKADVRCSDASFHGPGYRVLLLMYETLAEAADEAIEDGRDVDQAISEAVDGTLPVATFDRWQAFVSLALWTLDWRDIFEHPGSFDEVVDLSLTEVAYRVAQQVRAAVKAAAAE